MIQRSRGVSLPVDRLGHRPKFLGGNTIMTKAAASVTTRSWPMIRLAAILAAVLFATPALAHHCGESAAMIDSLERKYGETRRSVAVAKGGRSVVQTFANLTTGTWTIVVTDAKGTGCVLAHGDAFEPVAPVEPETETPL